MKVHRKEKVSWIKILLIGIGGLLIGVAMAIFGGALQVNGRLDCDLFGHNCNYNTWGTIGNGILIIAIPGIFASLVAVVIGLIMGLLSFVRR